MYIYTYRVSYNTTKYLLVPIIIKCTKIKTEDTLTWSQIFGRWSERQYRRVSSLFKKTQKNKQEPARSLALQCTSKPRVQHVHADTT